MSCISAVSFLGVITYTSKVIFLGTNSCANAISFTGSASYTKKTAASSEFNPINLHQQVDSGVIVDILQKEFGLKIAEFDLPTNCKPYP